MRIESCRKCGKELELIQNCSVCNRPTQFHCVNCDNITDEQIHLECYLSSFDELVYKVTEGISKH